MTSGESRAEGSSVYEEIVSSPRTTTLFVLLTGLFVSLFACRITRTGTGLLTIIFFGLGAFFLFYLLNYRTLVRSHHSQSFEAWVRRLLLTVPFDSIDGCRRDDTAARACRASALGIPT